MVINKTLDDISWWLGIFLYDVTQLLVICWSGVSGFLAYDMILVLIIFVRTAIAFVTGNKTSVSLVRINIDSRLRGQSLKLILALYLSRKD